mmetsp:Transcript_14034/g.39885  ORF Transcript_14034/g.39885 Transcript_14034/m.39885 type:complete len:284 (+) Transcript_14034:90-941(+)
MESSPLSLKGVPNAMEVVVHPLVLFNVLDHFIRRKENQARVIGSLLGRIEGGVVHIQNSFPVPHTEGEEVAVDMAFHRNMYELHQKANRMEQIVGWYTSGGAVNEHSLLFHKFFGGEMEQSPVHLCVDTDLSKGDFGVKAYVSEPFGLVGESALGSQFSPLPVSLPGRDGLTGLDVLLACKQDDASQSMALSDTNNLRSAFLVLLARLDAVTRYVDDVVAGRAKADNAVGRDLATTIAECSSVDKDEFQSLYNGSMQDHLMISYLANLTRAQLAVVQKLQSVV